MSKGNNISVYARYELLKRIDKYAEGKGYISADGKPNRSKALAELATITLDSLDNRPTPVANKEEKNVESIIQRHNAKRNKG